MHVRFDEDPAGAGLSTQRVEHRSEGYHPAFQLAENPAAYSGVMVPALGARRARDVWVAPLELEHPPGTRRVCHSNHRKSRSLRRAISYAARASWTSRALETSATGTSHQDS